MVGDLQVLTDYTRNKILSRCSDTEGAESTGYDPVAALRRFMKEEIVRGEASRAAQKRFMDTARAMRCEANY